MDTFVVVTCGIFGLAVGSFLNVVIHRVPAKIPLATDRSRCPSCNTVITARDNIPVVSWLLLGGKCRHCGAGISKQYPLVELASAALFVAAAIRFGPVWELPAFLVFFASLLALSVIDLKLYILPNRIVYPTLYICATLLVAAAIIDGEYDKLVRAAVGAAACWLVMLVIHLIQPRGMGFGDVRLSAIIGMLCGWMSYGHAFLAIFLGFGFGSVVGIALMLIRRRGRRDAIPFGPFLALGAVVAVLFGQPVIDRYSEPYRAATALKTAAEMPMERTAR